MLQLNTYLAEPLSIFAHLLIRKDVVGVLIWNVNVLFDMAKKQQKPCKQIYKQSKVRKELIGSNLKALTEELYWKSNIFFVCLGAIVKLLAKLGHVETERS